MAASYRSVGRKPTKRRLFSRSSQKSKQNGNRSHKRVTKTRHTVQQSSRKQQYKQNSILIQNMLEQREKKLDAPMLLITLMLLGIGLIALLSSSYPKAYYSSNIGPFYYFSRQLLFAIAGLAAMWAVSCYDYQNYKHWAKWLYLISLIMLVLVLTPLVHHSIRRSGGCLAFSRRKLRSWLLFCCLLQWQPADRKACIHSKT